MERSNGCGLKLFWLAHGWRARNAGLSTTSVLMQNDGEDWNKDFVCEREKKREYPAYFHRVDLLCTLRSANTQRFSQLSTTLTRIYVQLNVSV